MADRASGAQHLDGGCFSQHNYSTHTHIYISSYSIKEKSRENHHLRLQIASKSNRFVFEGSFPSCCETKNIHSAFQMRDFPFHIFANETQKLRPEPLPAVTCAAGCFHRGSWLSSHPFQSSQEMQKPSFHQVPNCERACT